MKQSILMIDDDAFLLACSKLFLEKHDFEVDTASCREEAIRLVQAAPSKYSVVVVDYRLQEEDGIVTTRSILEINARILILVFSGDRSRDAVMLSTRNGANAFVDKGEGPEVFLNELRKLCQKAQNEVLRVSDIPMEGTLSRVIQSIGMVGVSNELASVAIKVAKLKGKTGPVLILGESGVGKEIVARALHGSRKGPFKAVNCGDFLGSRGTARSELFGYVRGAFSGADSDRAGVFEEAAGGTIFLDEVYSLPPESQIGLLRALQENVVTRIGSSKEIPINCRIVAAAKPDLVQDISKQTFKSDLYYRISQNIVEVAPLRQRPSDIGPLVDYFCTKWSAENGETKTFLASTLPHLMSYDWPGNIRELQNVVYSVLNTLAHDEVRPEDLGRLFKRNSLQNNPGYAEPLRERVLRTEREHVIEVCRRFGTLKDAARGLGVSSQGLLRLFKKHGLTTANTVGASAGLREGNKRGA